MTHTITSLTPGVLYKIAVRALNSEGYSDMSYYLAAGASQLPDKPL